MTKIKQTVGVIMNWHENRARPITNDESDLLEYINNLLGSSPNEKIFAFIKIKCATEDGFFDKMMKHAFMGFYSQNDKLRRDVSELSTGLVMAESLIPKHKKETKKFETYKSAILRALKISRSFMNIDDIIEEYSNKENDNGKY